jgi:hypothetical protein
MSNEKTIVTGSDVLDDPAWYQESAALMEAPIYGGLCRLRAQSGWSTGPQGSDSDPGVHISLLLDTNKMPPLPARDGLFAYGGVLGRSGARILRDLLTTFLEGEHA